MVTLKSSYLQLLTRVSSGYIEVIISKAVNKGTCGYIDVNTSKAVNKGF